MYGCAAAGGAGNGKISIFSVPELKALYDIVYADAQKGS